jgi:hypothetical protein
MAGNGSMQGVRGLGWGALRRDCAKIAFGIPIPQGERKRDLRRLSRRYQDKMPVVFYQTVTTGRAAKGMPSWKGVLEDETLWTIFTFLETVQKSR